MSSWRTVAFVFIAFMPSPFELMHSLAFLNFNAAVLPLFATPFKSNFPSMYVRGTFNTWSVANKMTLVDDYTWVTYATTMNGDTLKL